MVYGITAPARLHRILVVVARPGGSTARGIVAEIEIVRGNDLIEVFWTAVGVAIEEFANYIFGAQLRAHIHLPFFRV
jgi:hypothetical protein